MTRNYLKRYRERSLEKMIDGHANQDRIDQLAKKERNLFEYWNYLYDLIEFDFAVKEDKEDIVAEMKALSSRIDKLNAELMPLYEQKVKMEK